MSKTKSMSKTKAMARTKTIVKNTADTAFRGVKTVGSVAKNVIIKSTPIVEKGITKVYGTLATGFDLGIKGAKGAVKSVSRTTKKKRSNRKTHRTY
jgi:hypothetical protein